MAIRTQLSLFTLLCLFGFRTSLGQDLEPVEDDDWGMISAVLYGDLTQIWVEPID